MVLIEYFVCLLSWVSYSNEIPEDDYLVKEGVYRGTRSKQRCVHLPELHTNYTIWFLFPFILRLLVIFY